MADKKQNIVVDEKGKYLTIKTFFDTLLVKRGTRITLNSESLMKDLMSKGLIEVYQAKKK